MTGLLLLFEVEITQWQAENGEKYQPDFIQNEQSNARLLTHTHQILNENPSCHVSYIRHNAQFLSLPWVYLTCLEGRKKIVVNLTTNQHYPLEKEGFQLILDLHRTLLLGAAGRQVVGIATLVIVFNIVSGLVLWFIRGKKLKIDKRKFQYSTRAGIRVRNFHSVTALYLTPILLIMALTGISWTWREEINQGLGLLQNKEILMPASKIRSSVDDEKNVLHQSMAPLETIYQKMAEDYPDHTILGIGPALKETDIVTVRLKNNSDIGFTPHLYLSLDAYTLAEIYSTDAWQAQNEDSLYAYRIVKYGLHTGFILGSLGKWLWALADLLFIASILLLGIYLWLKRRSKGNP